MRRRIVVLALLVAAVVLILVGAAIALLSPVDFGWTAYAPLSGESFSFTGMYPLTAARAAGMGTAVAGLLVIAGVTGWTLGRRSTRRGAR
ncbi:hypothetical protein [Leifsonia soli]|uniref:Heme/copper-type cytochrome/quinol oxidase subunit 1 n=1 Tax=Leifsonia soli TaxID=582665 RepID=A0A852T2F4_9MICO|nr:hypothetical protein [Leifsonia soli]NYD75798.1 heme/copper-type cytochrome/quinol oxidase subunit 1 [Leifsonia soli]